MHACRVMAVRSLGQDYFCLFVLSLQMSNPANRLPPEYDEMQPHGYDPEFTAAISTKMRVPDKIAAFNGSSLSGPQIGDIYYTDQERSARMNVPDKLVVAGKFCILCSGQELAVLESSLSQ